MEESLIEEIKVLNRENDMFETYDKAIAICNFLNLEVCKNFIEFIMSDTNFLDILFENRTYNDERVYNMINEINNII